MKPARPTAGALLAAALALVALPACHPTSVQIWKPVPPPKDAEAFEVERVRDVEYYEGKAPDPHKNHLDLYLPKGKKNYPVVVLVHGGSWVMGDNRRYGLVSSVGEFLASQGVGAAVPNYRLSPAVKHPEHVKDVARAVAWVRDHVGERGGDPNRLFLVGHSAGGHLVSLLATDEKYLREVGLRSSDLRGVVSVSGVYRIPSGNLDVALGGGSARAVRLDEVAPVRGPNPRYLGAISSTPGLPLSINFFKPAFGDDPKVREDASPLAHVRPALPPFLIVTAEKDLPTLTGPAGEFHRAILASGGDSEFLNVPKRNHNSVMYSAVEADDPVARAMLAFIRKNGGDH
jgi:acetyl esterase/lipase